MTTIGASGPCCSASSSHLFHPEIGTKATWPRIPLCLHRSKDRAPCRSGKSLASVKLNELDFTHELFLRQRVRTSTHSELNDGKPVLVKIAVWPWELPFMEVETTAYGSIRGSGIGPKFLGHVTEGKDGRVVGFVADGYKMRGSLDQEIPRAAGRPWGNCMSSGSSLAISTNTTFLCGKGTTLF